MKKKATLKINLDKTIFNSIIILLMLKILFSYLNVDLVWWQRHLTPNFEKFNILGVPKDTGKMIEYLIIPMLIIYLLKNIQFLKALSIIIIMVTGMLALNVITSLLNSIDILKSIEYTIKLMSPILLFIILVVHIKKYDYNINQLMTKVLTFCVILTIVGYLFFDVSYNHDRNWLPIYFSSIHTHSYVLVIVAIGFSYKIYVQRKYLFFFVFSMLFFSFLYFGHRIRTTLVFYLIYLILVSYTIHNLFKAIWIKFLINIPILVMLFVVINQDFDINEFSSGRITMYKAKYEMLKDYSIPEYIFGRGKGSDFIRTDYWWYSEKNSHNDILTFMVENGIPYMLLFLGMVFILMFINGKIKIIYSGLVFAYLVTSFLSNGLVLRPLPSYLFFLVLAYIYHTKRSDNSNSVISI